MQNADNCSSRTGCTNIKVWKSSAVPRTFLFRNIELDRAWINFKISFFFSTVKQCVRLCARRLRVWAWPKIRETHVKCVRLGSCVIPIDSFHSNSRVSDILIFFDQKQSKYINLRKEVQCLFAHALQGVRHHFCPNATAKSASWWQAVLLNASVCTKWCHPI